MPYDNMYSRDFPPDWPESQYDIEDFNSEIKVGDYVWGFGRFAGFYKVVEIGRRTFTVHRVQWYGRLVGNEFKLYKHQVMKAEHGVPLQYRVPQHDYRVSIDRRDVQRG